VSAVALAWEQFRFERRLFWRNPSAAFFNFFLPLILLLLIASVFAQKSHELEVLIPGVAGMSVMATHLQRLQLQPHLPARGGHPEATSAAPRSPPAPTWPA